MSNRSAAVFRRVAIGIAIGVCSVVVVEVVLQGVATHVLGRGRLFDHDPVVGWRMRRNLDLTRRNIEGNIWSVRTGECGLRGPCHWSPTADRRLLVLGDSFAFGEGVSLENRFDIELARARPRWSFVNLGVMGYGTDQEILAARPFVAQLNPGDVVLLLVYGNDFLDILRKSFAGRPKPWFEWTGVRVVEHPPTFLWFDYIRNYSYTAALLGRVAERESGSYSSEEIERAMTLFQAMLGKEIDLWLLKGLDVVVARHGMEVVSRGWPALMRTRLTAVWKSLCQRLGCYCTDLDRVLSASDLFQADGHWNVRGHGALARHLQHVLGSLYPGSE
jgi:hypothetical protein